MRSLFIVLKITLLTQGTLPISNFFKSPEALKKRAPGLYTAAKSQANPDFVPPPLQKGTACIPA